MCIYFVGISNYPTQYNQCHSLGLKTAKSYLRLISLYKDIWKTFIFRKSFFGSFYLLTWTPFGSKEKGSNFETLTLYMKSLDHDVCVRLSLSRQIIIFEERHILLSNFWEKKVWYKKLNSWKNIIEWRRQIWATIFKKKSFKIICRTAYIKLIRF